MATESLRACPFHERNPMDEGPRWATSNPKDGIVCVWCGASQKTVEKWNARPLEDAKDAEIARLRESQRWIPVTEALPTDLLEKLVVDEFGCVGAARSRLPYGSNRWAVAMDSMLTANITHWQELPAPPEQPTDVQDKANFAETQPVAMKRGE